MNRIGFLTVLGIMMLSSMDSQAQQSALKDADLTCGNVKFTKSLNVSGDMVKSKSNGTILTAGAQTDLFCDPVGVATNTTAPVMLTTIDNTRPFTFTVKVKPQFTKAGTYSAGAILAFVDESHWQKLCFEQDEKGNHRIVTVRTVGTSDDNNHERSESSSVYLRLSSNTKIIGSYYSEDGINWKLVRVYKNEFPATFFLGISSQSPKDKSHSCQFSDVSIVDKAVANFRKGSL